MKHYVENDKNLDGLEIYESTDDKKMKNIGALKGTGYDQSLSSDVTVYDKYDDLLNDLINHKLDAIIVDNGISNFAQAFDMDVSFLERSAGPPTLFEFWFQKNDTNHIKEYLNGMKRGWKKIL